MKNIYICNTNASNKFWSYEVLETSVHFSFGRLGESGQTLTKDCGSASAAQRLAETKVREKEKKGYKLVTKEKLKEEQSTSEILGSHNKISKMLFVSRMGLKLRQLDGYDPTQYVYVEILDSWSKGVTRLLLNKESNWMLGEGLIVADREMTATEIRELKRDHKYSEVVRALIRKLSIKVVEALQSIKFGGVAARKISLFDDDEDSKTPQVEEPRVTTEEALSSVDFSGFDKSVLMSFGAVGARRIEL